MLRTIVNDVRIALRSLVKQSGFAAVTILTLAVAIGANTAIFSVVDSVLLAPLPYPDEDRIVTVAAGTRAEVGGGEAPFSDRGYWHFVENNQSFEVFAGYSSRPVQVALTGDGDPLQVNVARMTLPAFELLGVLPQRGRLPTAEEDLPDGPDVMLVSDGIWRGRYGSDPDIIGKTLTMNGRPFEVIGVMPAGYDFPTPGMDVWAPYGLNPASENFGGHHIEGLGKLAAGSTLETATVDAEGLIGRFGEVGYGESWFTGVFDGTALVRPLRETIVGDSRQPLLILLGTVGFVLLIACSNVANLMLVRAEGRTRESGIRLALGSGRGRLIQQAMTESVVLSLIGGAAGVLLAVLGTRVLVSMAPASIPRLGEIGVSGAALLFTTIVSVAAGLLFGFFPAMRSGSRGSIAALRDGGRSATAGRERHRLRGALVVTQVALALVLLVGSGLMVRSFQELRSVDPGFQAEGLLTFSLRPLPTKYEGPEGVAQFYDRLIEQLESVPGVSRVGGITTLPLTGGGPYLTRMVEEFPPAEGEFPPAFHIRRATPGYFAAMGVPVVEGRAFNQDDHNLRLGSILISNSVKQRYWPQTSAIGKRISGSTIVGVVGDVHDTALDSEVEEFVYHPMLDSAGGGVSAMTMVLRTGVDPNSIVPSVRRMIGELDADLPLTDVRAMNEVVGDSLNRTTFTMTLLALAALIALFLGSVGIYGVISYTVSQRTAEIGVRVALGADPGQVRGLVIAQGMKLAVAGVGVGLLAAAALGRILSSLLYSVSPLDPLTLVGGSLLFLAVAGFASAVPAMRAARTHPAEALRAE